VAGALAQADDADAVASPLAMAGQYDAPVPANPGALAEQSPTARVMQQQGEKLIGPDPAGALTTASQAKDAARQKQMDSIDNAMSILRASNASVNLPMIAAGSALLSPTRTGSFGESMGNAGRAFVPAFQQQRKDEMDVANLGIQGAAVAAEGAREGYQDFLTRFNLGRQLESGAENDAIRRAIIAGQNQRAQLNSDTRITTAGIGAGARLRAAAIGADSRQGVAQTNADSRESVAGMNNETRLAIGMKPMLVTKGPTIQTWDPKTNTLTDTGEPTTDAQRLEWQQNHGDQALEIMRQRVEQQNSTYLGTDPDNPKIGIYLNKHTGETTTGAAVAGKGGAGSADPARIREAKALVVNNTAPDFATAYAMVRSGVNDTATFQRLVQAEKKILAATPAGMSMNDKMLENQARETVVARESLRAKPSAGSPGPGAPPAPAKPAPAPAPAAQPAAKYTSANPLVPRTQSDIDNAPSGSVIQKAPGVLMVKP
jgi:hypothetical protein